PWATRALRLRGREIRYAGLWSAPSPTAVRADLPGRGRKGGSVLPSVALDGVRAAVAVPE
ncbi:hypothetical protein, partial [Streptomyces sp. SID161]|uniref:hypothetical protein n=1 Tax=Streptomyces sp. SID161 TaxID=2690251 RepID=UPI00136857EC